MIARDVALPVGPPSTSQRAATTPLPTVAPAARVRCRSRLCRRRREQAAAGRIADRRRRVGGVDGVASGWRKVGEEKDSTSVLGLWCVNCSSSRQERRWRRTGVCFS